MNFFKTINLIITDRKALPIIFTSTNGKAAVKFTLTAILLVILLVSTISTFRIVNRLPKVATSTFSSFSINNGILSGPNDFVVPKWEIANIFKTVFAYTIADSLLPDSLVVYKDDNSKVSEVSLLTFTPTELHIGGLSSTMFINHFTWSKIIGDSFDFSEKSISKLLVNNSIAIFISMVLVITFDVLRNLIYLFIMLFILTRFLGRKSPLVKQPWLTHKIIAYSLTPYYILLPIFALAGTKSEWTSDIGLLLSALLISRALGEFKIVIKEDNNNE